jgi:tRNA pseudouridine13 synthase
LKEGLEQQRLDHDRRPLRLGPSELAWSWLDERSLQLRFALLAGSYATAVLRELVWWDSASAA